MKFENLDKYENGKEINYTIAEEKVEGFIAEIQNNPPRRAAILKINVEKIENKKIIIIISYNNFLLFA